MTGPLDSVLAFHNAFRADIKKIDAAALDLARGGQGEKPNLERFRFFNEVLAWHARGEELVVFPALERIAPRLAEPYTVDHRGLDTLSDMLSEAVTAGDPLATARATATFKFHLDIHLRKEDAQLYPLIRERLTASDLADMAGTLSKSVPQDRYPEAVAWLFPLLDVTDRENVMRNFQMLMPPPVFAGVAQLVRKAIGDDWAELTRRIPSLV
ncbi:MAG TPA: hemerythrin domain-containing protein [bacterium]|nr:hemerythrin domain-containing protein [bacterium]